MYRLFYPTRLAGRTDADLRAHPPTSRGVNRNYNFPGWRKTLRQRRRVAISAVLRAVITVSATIVIRCDCTAPGGAVGNSPLVDHPI